MQSAIPRKSAMTVSDVARRLQLPERSILYRLQKGELRGERGPKGWSITEENFDAFLQKVSNVEAETWRQWLRKARSHQ